MTLSSLNADALLGNHVTANFLKFASTKFPNNTRLGMNLLLTTYNCDLVVGPKSDGLKGGDLGLIKQ